MTLTPFHLAIQVRNIDEAREFYGVKMGYSLKAEVPKTGLILICSVISS